MKRAIIIGGREIVIDALGEPLDAAFDRLHAAYFGQVPLPWEEFETAVLDFFDRTRANWSAHDAYFNNFTVIWRSVLDAARYEHSEHIWERALQPALQWEQINQPQRIHKGTPYYFWSMTALLRGDVDHGYLLVHQAVQEDINTSQQQRLDTPGYALVSLNYNRVDQAFRQWVVEQAAFLNALLDNYNTIHTRTLTPGDIKSRFLDAPPDIETVFLFTYTLARLRGIATVPEHTTKNSFAGQLELNLLFDVTVVIETAIRIKNPTTRLPNNRKPTFINHAHYLLTAATEPLAIQQLGEVNQQYENDFDATLGAALRGAITLQPNTTLTRLQCDVALAYGIRNQGAHTTGSAPTIWNRFPEVVQGIFHMLFATIDHLYQ
jgi:hypothetical protein